MELNTAHVSVELNTALPEKQTTVLEFFTKLGAVCDEGSH